ncbi:hypothetical protein [Maribacter sp. 2210JD10-5]|uniref:hypothetical protein n=1 Tax=Maribacter sp. 2210JD10-5 TaxID=3386272 RepID=UPI0039BC343A
MAKKIVTIPILLVLNFVVGQKMLNNYIFFNIDRHRIQERSFLQCDACVGAQLKYSWKELEPIKNTYDFSEIDKDLAFLTKKGKKLFIQVQDVSFDTLIVNVPNYILKDPIYSGGVAIQYLTTESDSIIRQDGYVARRWDDTVAQRFYRLLHALGEHFDGKIEGINLPESIVGFGETGRLYPEGFTPERYANTIATQMKVLRKAFPNTTVIQYANYMPGEWLPWEDKGYLESLYETAAHHDVGMGGPDIKIYKKSQMNHSYKFLKEYSNLIKTGIAVQWGNYEEPNPKTGKRVRVEEIYNFGENEIGLDYIFWCTQEPYYSQHLLPFLKERSGHD